MPSENPRLTLTLPSDLRLLSVARAFVEAVGYAGGFDPAAINAIVLATNEAVSNVIRHAHHDQPTAQLQIQCRLVAEGLEICLLDEGQPFDLAAVPELDPGELRVGGRGVFLMRSVMDELSCQPRPERGNALRMVKRRGCDSPARECG